MNQKHLKFIAMFFAGALLVSACGKDDPKPATGFPTEFSEKSIEENKKALEDNGIELINSLDEMKGAIGIKASIAFGKHLDGSTLPENIGGRLNTNQGMRVITLLSSLGSGKTSASKTLSGMRIKEEEFESFQDEFNNAVGVYTYNKANDTWTYEDSGDKIVFKFPSTENGTTNNAEYTVYDYTGTQIDSELGGDEYTGDYPTGLKAALKVDGAQKMTYEFSAAYNSDGDPKAVSFAITVDQFKLSYSVKNSVSEASVDYSLKKGDKNLLSFGASAKGTFSTGEIEEGGADALKNGTAYFQIGNIKFLGEVDATKLSDALENAETETEAVAAWNANYRLVVFYADNNKKIAETEFYSFTSTEEYEYCYWDWDEETQEEIWNCTTEVYDEERMDIRLIFADGSKSDLAAYTDVGFSELEETFEQFVEELENE